MQLHYNWQGEAVQLCILNLFMMGLLSALEWLGYQSALLTCGSSHGKPWWMGMVATAVINYADREQTPCSYNVIFRCLPAWHSVQTTVLICVHEVVIVILLTLYGGKFLWCIKKLIFVPKSQSSHKTIQSIFLLLKYRKKSPLPRKLWLFMTATGVYRTYE